MKTRCKHLDCHVYLTDGQDYCPKHTKKAVEKTTPPTEEASDSSLLNTITTVALVESLLDSPSVTPDPSPGGSPDISLPDTSTPDFGDFDGGSSSGAGAGGDF